MANPPEYARSNMGLLVISGMAFFSSRVKREGGILMRGMGQ